MLSPEDLRTLADLNLAEANREQARWFPPSHIDEREDRLFVSGGSRFPAGPFNSAMATEDPPDPDAFLAAARAHFAAIQRGFTIFIRGHRDTALAAACEQAGYTRIGNSPGMVLDAPLDPPALAPHLAIRTLHGIEQAPSFIGVAAAAFEALGMPAEVTRKMLSCPQRWLQPHWHVEVLFARGEPVSGAMLLLSHGIAGVYWVGTLSHARGKGYAAAVMRSISNRAFELGARAVVLQASEFGEPVYKRLGYREFTRYPWYLVRAEQTRA